MVSLRDLFRFLDKAVASSPLNLNRLCRFGGMDFEVPEQRTVVGQLDRRHLESDKLDFRAVKNEVELAKRPTTGIGGLAFLVGAVQSAGREKQLEFALAP